MAQAFHALSNNPELCGHVKDLEVRVFDLTSNARLEALQDQVLEALRHMNKLQSLVWTRKGSLSAKLLDAICALEQLEALEFNASPAGDWRPEQLLSLPPRLKSLSLVLPDREVISTALPQWLCTLDPQARTLQSLSIICRTSPVLNSTTLHTITNAGLSSLTSFTLLGCKKLNDDDVLHALKGCGNLKHLALEAISISSTFYLHLAGTLPHLESLRTSHPGRRDIHINAYYQGLTLLVESCPKFKSFTHYLSGNTERGFHPPVCADFVSALVKSCGSRLERFEISGLSLGLESIRDLCMGARDIEQLVLPVLTTDIVSLAFTDDQSHRLFYAMQSSHRTICNSCF